MQQAAVSKEILEPEIVLQAAEQHTAQLTEIGSEQKTKKPGNSGLFGHITLRANRGDKTPVELFLGFSSKRKDSVPAMSPRERSGNRRMFRGDSIIQNKGSSSLR